MVPSITPSPPPSKEPPDKNNRKSILSPPRPTLDTSVGQGPTKPSASLTQRPPFAPFFTLITDTTTSTTYHPRNVHYIFSDDDPSPLTAACLEALNPPSATSSTSLSQPPPNPSTSSSSTTSKSPSSSTAIRERTLDARRERENRILILDLDASGSSVRQAHSLSSSWQILSTSLTPAPTWAESPSEPHASSSLNGPGFMLKISGTDGRQSNAAPGLGLGIGKDDQGEGKGAGEGARAELTEADFHALMHDFDQKMKMLRTVVEAGNDVGHLGEQDADQEKDGDRDAA